MVLKTIIKSMDYALLMQEAMDHLNNILNEPIRVIDRKYSIGDFRVGSTNEFFHRYCNSKCITVYSNDNELKINIDCDLLKIDISRYDPNKYSYSAWKKITEYPIC